jgi:hypothetical protein
MYGSDGGRKGSGVSKCRVMKFIVWIKKVEKKRSEMQSCLALNKAKGRVDRSKSSG